MDLYHIPNDDGVSYRLKKFVEYQHNVPSIHYRFAGEWAKKKGFGKDRAIQLCWYLSATYNEITAILIDYLVNEQRLSYKEIWQRYGERLDFGSARKHAKYNGRFLSLMKSWTELTHNRPCEWLKAICTGDAQSNYGIISGAVRNLPNVGRFAADIFLEGLAYLQAEIGLSITEPIIIDWDNGANLTSGIFNIFYVDGKAQAFEHGERLTKSDKVFLSNGLAAIQKAIQETYPCQDSEIQSFIGKICSFRNLFKGARYGGFHHDRQLGVIRAYQAAIPNFDDLWEDTLKLRKEMFPHHLLGELNGWDGIRPERKKLWLREGLTGAEEAT